MIRKYSIASIGLFRNIQVKLVANISNHEQFSIGQLQQNDIQINTVN